ncbi:hypothetical protein Afil01_06240 [Actinorhabdospora filicis]|uniref:N-acetylmuramoyl-L-alanine amidase n=1 Tax=Actinorhabdospora filicis TaxID=1785913 RepID=A0A9W6W1E9_9ACTN|nr:N-acetylmuramoyl-L-alanine amidase [Actinorhabdospora filicis]GLZ75817.1 hypothetical protein Afil01_06240 [Actinorhabdospora filicis]
MSTDPLISRRTALRGGLLLGAGIAVGGFEVTLASDAAAAAVPNPGIASCTTWGARAVGGLNEIATRPNKILVHHTDTPNQTDVSKDAAYRLARSIQNYHMDHNGWSDTGQHFTNSRGGYVMEGRHTSLAHLTSGSGMVVGAHCPGQNNQAIGIENEGTYMTAEPPAAQWNRLIDLCAYICQQYAIAPTQIFGHRDYLATDCPGDVLYAKLPALRQAVADRLNGTPPSFQVVLDAPTAGANWGSSSYSAQRYGADYRYASPQAVSDGAYYRATLPAAGNYKVETWYPADPGYNPSTPFVVFASGGNSTVTVDQRANGGKWTNLGTFAFGGGERDILAVSRWSSGAGYVIADAVRVTAV